MKKYCMLLLGQLIMFFAPKDQDNITYTKMADSLLSPVNKSLITSGVLYDRIAPFAVLHTFKIILPDGYDSLKY